MPDTSSPSNRAALWVRWIARALGSLVVVYWVIVGITSAIGDDAPWTWESTVIVVLIAASAVSVAVAWWREGIGGLLLLVCGVALGAFAGITAAHSRGVAVLLAGSPLVVVGVLFVGSWWGARPRRR